MARDTPDLERLERRLAAVESAVGEQRPASDATPADDTESADPTAARTDRVDRADELADRVQELTTRLDELTARVDELDAALQAVRGYLGGVDAVNEAVERRADAAVATVDRLERRLEESPSTGETGGPPPAEGGRPVDDEESTESEGVAGEQSPQPPTDESERSLRQRLRNLR